MPAESTVQLAMLILVASLLMLYGVDLTHCLEVLGDETDKLALLDFKKATIDPNGALRSWNTTTTCCQWDGVSCSLQHLGRVTVLDLGGHGLSGPISASLGKLTFLKILNLSTNFFSGGLPPLNLLGNLKSLSMLNLSHNNLSGVIPIDLSQLQHLSQLDLSYNNLQGEIPTTGVFGNASSVSFVGNTGLCGGVPDLHMPTCRTATISRGREIKYYLITILIPIFGLISLLVLGYFCIAKVKDKGAHSTLLPTFGDKFLKIELDWEKEYGPPSFTYKDLFAATNGFKDHMLLGKGGFGSVFKGLLPHSKQTVAIKRVSPESKQGMKEFMAEIIILGHLRHRNLVHLLGYCRHKQQLLLVYDYMPNGSLDCLLHTHHQNTTNLFWAQRFHIIKGIASGLFYLHEDWEQVVIHRDIKTSNVLLDSEMNARLGDFGLARSHDHGADAHTTRVAGTWGYIAPELARLGKATKATDIFAFGVLMMEVAYGRRPIWMNTDNREPLALGDWVLAAWQGDSITDAVDPRLDDYVEEEIELVLKLGLLCSHPSPNVRPCMRLVMQYLQKDAHLPSDLDPNSLLNIGLVQDEMHDQHAMSCPATVITDLSKGR